MSGHNIITKINKVITKYGIPYYVKKWKKIEVPKNFDPYYDPIFLNKYVKTYHPHSFTISKFLYNKHNKSIKKNQIKQKNEDERPMPTFKYDQKNKIGMITFYHFITSHLTEKEVKKENKKMVRLVEGVLKKWDVDNLNGLIIDLRKHSGGNMWPAIESLKTILGNNVTLLSFSNVKTKKSDNKWVNIKNGKINNGKYISNKLVYIRPIAILVSDDTASSGEFIAATFYGRENVKIFGDNTIKTAGALSANTSIKINNDITLFITVTLCTTADGTFHLDECLYVDKKTKTPVTDAKKWIMKQKK